MKVLVTGGRAYSDWERVFGVLDELEPELLIEGGGTGADALAKEWAEDRDVPSCTFHAHWQTSKDGYKSAGPKRNSAMIKFAGADLVLAFPGGRGTADTVAKARRAGIEVREVS